MARPRRTSTCPRLFCAAASAGFAATAASQRARAPRSKSARARTRPTPARSRSLAVPARAPGHAGAGRPAPLAAAAGAPGAAGRGAFAAVAAAGRPTAATPIAERRSPAPRCRPRSASRSATDWARPRRLGDLRRTRGRLPRPASRRSAGTSATLVVPRAAGADVRVVLTGCPATTGCARRRGRRRC